VETPSLPPPREWLFRAGIACPLQTRMFTRGPTSAFRLCVLSTGTMVEKVDVFQTNRQLHFQVLNTPPVMNEWSPWNIHPAHLQDVMQMHAGQFLLSALPGGRTRVVGTSWYHHDIWPSAYWRLWSDSVVHQVHRRVLNEIKARSERDQLTASPSAQSSGR